MIKNMLYSNRKKEMKNKEERRKMIERNVYWGLFSHSVMMYED